MAGLNEAIPWCLICSIQYGGHDAETAAGISDGKGMTLLDEERSPDAAVAIKGTTASIFLDGVANFRELIRVEAMVVTVVVRDPPVMLRVPPLAVKGFPPAVSGPSLAFG